MSQKTASSNKIEDTLSKKYIPKKEFWIFTIAALGQNLAYSCMSSYVTDYYINVLRLAPMFVLLLMLFARVWDAVNDPLMGMIVDRHESKRFGRMRPYPVATAIPIAVLTILMFTKPNLVDMPLMIYTAVVYVLWGMIYTSSDVPFWSLPNVMTPNPDERGRIISLGRTFGGISTGIVTALPMIVGPILKNKGYSDVGADEMKYKIMAISCAVLGMVLFCTVSFSAKERIKLPNAKPNEKAITQKRILVSIILSIITFGIYTVYWQYLLIKNTIVLQKKNSGQIIELLCWLFVPFYSIYWWYSRGKIVKSEFSKRGYLNAGNEIIYLVLAIFKLDFISMMIMQNDFNSIELDEDPEKEFVIEKSNLYRVFHCKPLMLVVLSGTLSFGRYMLQAAAPHVARYAGFHMKDDFQANVTAVALTIQICVAIGMFGAMVVVPFLYKKFNYKKLMIYTCIAGFVMSLLTCLIGWTTKNLYFCIPTMIIASIPLGVINVVSYAMVCDSLDYMEWETGHRNTALGSACQSFVNKLGNALSTVMIIGMYMVVNIDVDKMYDASGAAAISLTGGQEFAMFSLVTIVPGVSLLLCAVPLFFYDLVDEKKDKITLELAQQREAKGIIVE